MPIKLHRCKNLWAKFGGHPCWKVQQALDEQGIEYEVVRHPWPFGRDEVKRISGQKMYPVIEFEDGTIYRDDSKTMAERIRSGNLRQGDQGSPAVSQPTST